MKYSDKELFLRVMVVTPDTPWSKSRDERNDDSVEGLALQVLTRVKNGMPLPRIAVDEDFTKWDWVLMDIYRRKRKLYQDVPRYRSLLSQLTETERLGPGGRRGSR